jgi:hypothetical protein
MKKSSQEPKRQVLGVISAKRAEQMLTEWVNTDPSDLTENAKAKFLWERFFRRYPEIPSVTVDSIVPTTDTNFNRFRQQVKMALSVAGYLRRAWDAPDLRKSDWYTRAAQSEYEYLAASARHGVTPLEEVMERNKDGTVVRRSAEDRAKIESALREIGEPPAVITPVEAATFYLQHNRDRALHCPNPECPAPYFFRTKKGQKFCSPECAKPSQRESKRQWWAANRAKERNV